LKEAAGDMSGRFMCRRQLPHRQKNGACVRALISICGISPASGAMRHVCCAASSMNTLQK
jgi:hypothetical protein